MTDNIQKLYEIAGVEDIGEVESCSSEEYENCECLWKFDCLKCEKAKKIRPPFTAEKQLELIKFISNTDVFCNFHCYIVSARWSVDYGQWAVGVGGCDVCHEQFEQALAGLVLEMWDGIPVNQKQEIKRILQ